MKYFCLTFEFVSVCIRKLEAKWLWILIQQETLLQIQNLLANSQIMPRNKAHYCEDCIHLAQSPWLWFQWDHHFPRCNPQIPWTPRIEHMQFWICKLEASDPVGWKFRDHPYQSSNHHLHGMVTHSLCLSQLCLCRTLYQASIHSQLSRSILLSSQPLFFDSDKSHLF